MSEKAKEVIAEAFKDAEVRCNWTAQGHAKHALDALKAARIAVVELPKPDSTRYEGDEHEPEDRLSWMPDDDFEVSVWRDGRVQRYGYGWGDIEPLSAEQARTVGLALLAAADAAEAVSHE